jgi:ATP-dependent exoDNAse (exonuclease V) alpha subunit
LLIAKSQRDTLRLNDRTVVVMDEAGMADTNRLAQLSELTAQTQSKLVLVGDAAQLSPIGAGGLFHDLQRTAPSAELAEIHRAREPWERQAWAQVRAGESARALAAYQARERLHIADTREQAAQELVQAWDEARLQHGTQRVTMLTDASNVELDRINAKAQARRARRGELGSTRIALPKRPYTLAAGDEIIFTAAQHRPGKRRVENGTLAQILDANEHGTLTVRTREPTPRELDLDTQEFAQLKLAYAQHVYKAQGQTVDRALVLAGGWQTDRERAYVALTRARDRTDIYVARADLGQDAIAQTTLDRLAATFAHSNAQQASIAHPQASIAHPQATPHHPALDRNDNRPATDRDPPTPDRERESEAARILRKSREQAHEHGNWIE